MSAEDNAQLLLCSLAHPVSGLWVPKNEMRDSDMIPTPDSFSLLSDSQRLDEAMRLSQLSISCLSKWKKMGALERAIWIQGQEHSDIVARAVSIWPSMISGKRS